MALARNIGNGGCDVKRVEARHLLKTFLTVGHEQRHTRNKLSVAIGHDRVGKDLFRAVAHAEASPPH